ncbi:mischarged aminoacyl-tRNA deacylase [Kitasatospora nipponensis]|uniref:Mischarged aminoacyl-tRNA deacylase n=1 Tax=Kitasatospora nipponensis TaxID=258049 RepID=A0ABP4GAI3_9ACTN
MTGETPHREMPGSVVLEDRPASREQDRRKPELAGYVRLMDFLDEAGRPYRTIDHAPEGQTARASVLRGHALAAAAKCMVVTVVGAAGPDGSAPAAPVHAVAVIPGDRRVDLAKVASACGGGRATLAERGTAERLAGSVSGTITPFSFHPQLRLLADPALFDHEELYFNAARLDRSLAIRAEDYRALAAPRVVEISEPPR